MIDWYVTHCVDHSFTSNEHHGWMRQLSDSCVSMRGYNSFVGTSESSCMGHALKLSFATVKGRCEAAMHESESVITKNRCQAQPRTQESLLHSRNLG